MSNTDPTPGSEVEPSNECPVCGGEIDPELYVKSMVVEDGVVKLRCAPHWGVRHLLLSFKDTLQDAPNYMDSEWNVATWSFKDAGQDEVWRISAAVIRPGHQSPHEMHMAAKQRVEELEAELSSLRSTESGESDPSRLVGPLHSKDTE